MTRSLYLHHPLSLEHETGEHPERPERIRAIEQALEQRDWLGYERELAPEVSLEALYAVHPKRYVDAIRDVCERGGGMLDLDTVASPRSYEAALHSAGGNVRAVDALLGGEAQLSFCGLRPPGHHAEPARAMGFCLFNNVAVAARHALDAHGAERVLVLDWDVHHGNGTNDIFHSSDQVLYVSIHQWPLYPGTGALEDNGEGKGLGHTVNLPVPPGSGHETWLSLVQHVVTPIAREYRPALLMVSAGFDAHRDDPLANCELSDASFAAMTASLRDLGQEIGAPLAFTLEGGYDLRALGDSVVAVMGAARNGLAAEPIDEDAVTQRARAHYARWWDSLG
jgi:acetoin utilization deacetylase AcuC-like enzyme